jgi:hypothetical protein
VRHLLLVGLAGCTTHGAQATAAKMEYKHDATGEQAVALTAGADDSLHITGQDPATQLVADADFLVIQTPGAEVADALGGLTLQMLDDGGVLDARFAGAVSESAVLRRLDVTMPSGLGLTMDSDEGEIDVEHVLGPVTIRAQGSVTVRDVGPIDLQTDHGATVELDGDGQITASEIDATITGTDFEAIRFDGPASVQVPPGQGWNLHFDGAWQSTQVRIHLGGADVVPTGPDVTIGAGGPTLSFKIPSSDDGIVHVFDGT